jgi:hypothetical protein
MSVALKKRDLLFGERFSPFILIHWQNRYAIENATPRFCRRIKMQNCRVTDAQTDECGCKSGSAGPGPVGWTCTPELHHERTNARTHRRSEFIYKIANCGYEGQPNYTTISAEVTRDQDQKVANRGLVPRLGHCLILRAHIGSSTSHM